MTKQEIITLLIKDYEQAIEKCKGMKYEDIRRYLNQENLDAGVCFAASTNHGGRIYGCEWVKRHGYYWFEPPMFLNSKQDIIQSLQTRLSILKTELEIPEQL